MNFDNNLAIFKNFIKENELDFFIVNSTDQFLNEYNELENNSRYLLSGFSGSTGDLLIGAKKTYLFVDGRYHTQAEQQVNSKFVEVVKLGLAERQTIKMAEILKSFQKKLKVGIVTSKTSLFQFKFLSQELRGFDVDFVEFDVDPVEKMLSVKKSEKDYLIWKVPNSITGKTVNQKITELKKSLDLDFLVITKLDEIAYLTNFRANQIELSSSFKSVAFFDKQKSKIYVFCDAKKIPLNAKFNSLIFNEFKQFQTILTKLGKNKKIGFSSSSVSVSVLRLIESITPNIVELKTSFVGEMKSVKTKQEIEHLKKCFKKSDNAQQKFQKWLNKEVNNGNKLNETFAADKLKEFFIKEKAYALSFDTILAVNKNSASAHYHPHSDVYFAKDDAVLLDCGCYFNGGYATDSTRTFVAGGGQPQDAQWKTVYTIVLKAFLNAMNAKISLKTTGFSLDRVARRIIEKHKPEGFSFKHSTGHGVGINVHDGLPFISSSEFAKQNLKPNMVFTIEPGLYNSDFGGVRIENTVFLDENYKIQSLSKLGFDDNLIDYKLLSKREKTLLNKYLKEK